jgi:hypothetical protein
MFDPIRSLIARASKPSSRRVHMYEDSPSRTRGKVIWLGNCQIYRTRRLLPPNSQSNHIPRSCGGRQQLTSAPMLLSVKGICGDYCHCLVRIGAPLGEGTTGRSGAMPAHHWPRKTKHLPLIAWA